MVRKIIQWVPIDGTRWRNEFVNRHENDGVGIRYGVAHRGVMAPFASYQMPLDLVVCWAPSWGPCNRSAARLTSIV
jgi:hypothetical protein